MRLSEVNPYKYSRVPFWVKGVPIAHSDYITDCVTGCVFVVYKIKRDAMVFLLYNAAVGLKKYSFAVLEKCLAEGQLRVNRRYNLNWNFGFMNRCK
jgi:hypothetical protein